MATANLPDGTQVIAPAIERSSRVLNPTMNTLRSFSYFAILLLFANVDTIEAQESRPEHDLRLQWWREARFGMFIHWGLYAIPAGEWGGKTNYGEWIRSNAEIPLEVYDTLQQHFNPKQFDADDWARMARAAGMKYMVLTSKHHDGFALFDSKVSGFDVMATPFRRDVVRELADACRKHGITFGVYYSIMDWHHPDYLPRRPWETDRTAAGASYDRYVGYMKAQLKELLTNYGPLGVLWFDGEWESTWSEDRGKDLYAYVRSLQPDIIINNRVGAGRQGMEGQTAAGRFGGDFGTPEQEVPSTGIPGVDWESCMTMNNNWGYNRADKEFKSSTQLIRTLIDIASKGGNYLLNVGPTSAGEFPQESVERLREIGDWMNVNGESIYGTTAGPFKDISWGRCTQKETGGRTVLYFHLFDWPSDGELFLAGLATIPERSYLVASPSGPEVSVEQRTDGLVLRVPRNSPTGPVSVLALEFEGEPTVINAPELLYEVPMFVDSMMVRTRGRIDGLLMRYTLDGSEPGATATAARDQITLRTSCLLAVRYFSGEKPVSGTTRARFDKVSPLNGVVLRDPTPGVSYSYYEGEWDRLPDFSSLIPITKGTVEEFSLRPRAQDERFGFEFRTYVLIPRAGVYTFSATSDDGSRLWVHDSLVIDNDGLHAATTRRGSIALSEGYHPIRVSYFERTGGDELKVSMRTLDGVETPLGAPSLFLDRP